MALTQPVLLAIAGALAAVGLWRLLRPPRLRVVVSHRQLWEQALAEVRRQRAWRPPPLWAVLLATGGLALAGSAGGMVWIARRPAPPPVLVLVADTPQLAVTHAGRTERDRLMDRLDELFSRLDRRTPVRLVVLSGGLAETRSPRDVPNMGKALFSQASAGDWPRVRGEVSLASTGLPPDGPAVERTYRRPEDAAVYMLGEFDPSPPGRPDVQWVFRPRPPADDVGIAAAGAMRTGQGGELFVEVRRYAGPGGPVRVIAQMDKPVASPPLDLAARASARVVMPMPPGFDNTILIRLDRQDDQPENNEFRLAPESAPAGTATFELVGRPNEWIVRACRAGRLRGRAANEPSSDWLIVNEPADPVAAAPGQGMVLIDPLAMPRGVRLMGELADVRIASRRADRPWADLPLDGLAVRRASHVELDSRWQPVAGDEGGRPMIAWDPSARVLAVFFSAAPDNTDWFSQKSWPLFWNVLADLVSRAGGPGERIRWTWNPGSRPGIAEIDGERLATNIPPQVFEVRAAARPPAAAIRPPAEMQAETPVAVWSTLACAGVVLLVGGWVLALRRGESDGAGASP